MKEWMKDKIQEWLKEQMKEQMKKWTKAWTSDEPKNIFITRYFACIPEQYSIIVKLSSLNAAHKVSRFSNINLLIDYIRYTILLGKFCHDFHYFLCLYTLKQKYKWCKNLQIKKQKYKSYIKKNQKAIEFLICKHQSTRLTRTNVPQVFCSRCWYFDTLLYCANVVRFIGYIHTILYTCPRSET